MPQYNTLAPFMKPWVMDSKGVAAEVKKRVARDKPVKLFVRRYKMKRVGQAINKVI